MTRTCRICLINSQPLRYSAREMMFGLRTEFDYVFCEACGCLQIASYPVNIADYYPHDYYSKRATVNQRPNLRVQLARRVRAYYELGRPDRIGNILSHFYTSPTLYKWLRMCKIGPSARILDVGSGGGKLLRFLESEGFTNLVGLDPYGTDESTEQMRLYKSSLEDYESEPHDLIMLHHSLEHMPDQPGVFSGLRRLCHAGTAVLISTPLVDSFAWEHYGTDWVQLDAPRHFYIHSRQSLAHLAHGSGFCIKHIEYDSTAFQFWASELFRKDVSLAEAKTSNGKAPNAHFGHEELMEWEVKAAELNRVGLGDQATLLLYPVGQP